MKFAYVYIRIVDASFFKATYGLCIYIHLKSLEATYKLWDYNKLRGLKRYLERFGWLERSGWLECFGWIGCHYSLAALEALNWRAIIQGNIYIF